MANTSSQPLVAAFSRVFIIEGRARPDHRPTYHSCLRMGGISQDFGDIERIECPDPYKYGAFIEVGSIRGATGRATATLEGRYMMDVLSTLARLAKLGCPFDVQVHLGTCQDPSDFNVFTKGVVFEDGFLTNFGTDDLGVLASGDNAAVNENSDLSAKEFYEVKPVTVSSVAGSIITNEILGITINDVPSCGDCAVESDGCNLIFAITSSAGGSPSTPPDVVFSTDGGVNWYAHDIDSMLTAETPSDVAVMGSYVVVIANATDSLHYVLKSELNAYTDPTWTEVATGFVAAGSPNAIWSVGSKAFIVGDGGYIYSTEDPTSGVTVLNAGSAVSDNLNDVHALSSVFAVAVGNSGAVVYTTDGEIWAAATTRPVGAGVHLNCVWAHSDTVWFVGTSNGRLYYTLNAGVTWTEKAFPGSGSGVVYDIAFSNGSVGFMSHSTTTPRGRVLRTYDGGYSWNVTPEASGTFPLNDRLTALAACSYDPNFFAAGGLADDGNDGFIAIGSAA